MPSPRQRGNVVLSGPGRVVRPDERSDIKAFTRPAVSKAIALESNLKLPASVIPGSTTATTLSARPASAATGSFFYATDQAVLYLYTGSAWTRISVPAGATVDWFESTSAVPTGWVKYDGGTLAGSTGIYADLYAHLGSTTTLPDTRGRVTVGKGTHTSVDAMGENDGVAVGNRTPLHNTTAPSHSLTLPNHVHPNAGQYRDMEGAATISPITVHAFAFSADGNNETAYNTNNPSSNPAIGGTVGAPGPGGTLAVDTPAYIVCLKIAKL